MLNRFALHTWTLDTTPLGRVLEIVRETGWQAIELRRLDFARAAEQGKPAEAVLDLVRSSGVPTACVGVTLGWMEAEGAPRAKVLPDLGTGYCGGRAFDVVTVISPLERGTYEESDDA